MAEQSPDSSEPQAPAESAAEPAAAQTAPAAAELDKPAVEPDKPAVEPDKSAAEPDRAAAERKPAAEPEKPAGEAKKPAAGQTQPAAAALRPAPRRVGLWAALILALLVLGGLTAAGLWSWQWLQGQQQREQAQIAALSEQIQQQRQQLQALRQQLQQAESSQQQQAATQQRSLATLRQRLDSQNKRLLSMASTDRDDWRLAEAEYLLQLANQRLLIEADSGTAEGLLAAADKILMELQDVDLFVVREGINRDLTALKLSPKIDREGVYLRLAALAAQVQGLAVLPSQSFVQVEPAVPVAPASDAIAEPVSRLLGFKQYLRARLDRLADYIRISRHDETVRPLLPPDSQSYVQQNLRFMLERAQLALMRQQQVVYQGSIQQARDWLLDYYSLTGTPAGLNATASRFDAELEQLQLLNVVESVPDISQSLEQLQAYIEKLHKLKSAPPAAPAAQEAGK